MVTRECWRVDLGLVGYAEAWDFQRRLVAARKADTIPDVLLLCQHPPVITLGRNAKRTHLLASQQVLRQMKVELYETDRGGDITYHGPGQVVGYPILNLARIRRDVVWYVRQLEEAMIRATADLGISAHRSPGRTGVWTGAGGAGEEKLAAIGVHISRWITSHGFAYNVSTNLQMFDLIVPCGIPEARPTSLERLLGRAVAVEEASTGIAGHLAQVLGLDMRHATREELDQAVERVPVYAP